MKIYITITLILFFTNQLLAKSIEGWVYDHNHKNVSLIGVNVYWMGTINGTATDAVSSIIGDNGEIVLQTSTGVLLSIESTDFAFGGRDLINLSAGTNAVIGGLGADGRRGYLVRDRR